MLLKSVLLKRRRGVVVTNVGCCTTCDSFDGGYVLWNNNANGGNLDKKPATIPLHTGQMHANPSTAGLLALQRITCVIDAA